MEIDMIPIRNMIFCGCLCYLALTDFKTYRIPNGCLGIAALTWAVCALISGAEFSEFLVQIVSAIFLGGFLLLISFLVEKMLKKSCLGYGDVKLFMVVGLYFGVDASLFVVLLSCILGLLFAIVQAVFLKKQPVCLPFGPCIAMACWIMLLYGRPLMNWYDSFRV